MPRLAKQRFTEATLDKLAAKAPKDGRRKVYFDGGTPHLGIAFRNGRGRFFCWFRSGGIVKRSYMGERSEQFDLAAAKAALAGEVARVKVEKIDLVEESKRQRDAARVERQKIEAAEVGTVEKRFKRFVAHKEAAQLRTVSEYESVFKNHVLPKWRNKPVQEITKADIAKLLDGIEEKHAAKHGAKDGAKLRDRALAYIRPFLWWHADKYDHPVPLMPKRLLKPDLMRRTRSLDDDEIRLVWTTAETFETPAFAALVKLLLVTGQRRSEVSGMRRDEIDTEWLWTIPAERFKGKVEHSVHLSQMAREIIAAAPKNHDDYVISTGENSLSGYSKFKAAFDEAMLTQARKEAEEAGRDPDKVKLKSYRLHDLRRTARSLLSRAGVRADWAEIFIGHAMPGLRKTYDRHSYIQEKRFCADALANMIGRILRRETGEVLQFKPAAA